MDMTYIITNVTIYALAHIIGIVVGIYIEYCYERTETYKNLIGKETEYYEYYLEKLKSMK